VVRPQESNGCLEGCLHQPQRIHIHHQIPPRARPPHPRAPASRAAPHSAPCAKRLQNHVKAVDALDARNGRGAGPQHAHALRRGFWNHLPSSPTTPPPLPASAIAPAHWPARRRAGSASSAGTSARAPQSSRSRACWRPESRSGRDSRSAPPRAPASSPAPARPETCVIS
jgi:hypothetical protein